MVSRYSVKYLGGSGEVDSLISLAAVHDGTAVRYVDHITIALDGTVYSGIQDALAKRSISLNCFALSRAAASPARPRRRR